MLSLLYVAALLSPALAIVQPSNTPILGPYGSVPPVYPSRRFSKLRIMRNSTNGFLLSKRNGSWLGRCIGQSKVISFSLNTRGEIWYGHRCSRTMRGEHRCYPSPWIPWSVSPRWPLSYSGHRLRKCFSSWSICCCIF